jgi:hypothetical protein
MALGAAPAGYRSSTTGTQDADEEQEQTPPAGIWPRQIGHQARGGERKPPQREQA